MAILSLGNSNSTFSGSFSGSGANLTGIISSSYALTASHALNAGGDAFPFTGDAQITGSLIISQSYTAGDTDSTALRLFGSGSVSESGIFEVEGSAGPLFSVQDGLDGILMEVNNISGLPLFQVSSSNEVFINRGNLTSGVTTATASFAMFSGSFQGNASQLTNLNFAGSGVLSGSITSQLPSGVVSGSAQIASNISGAFFAPSASFSTRVSSNETSISTLTGKTLVSGSAQLASNISGAFFAPSASFSTRVSTNETKISTLTGKTLVSGSAQIASNISGSWQGQNFISASQVFPFTGGAQITGSLVVSGSFVNFRDAPLSASIITASNITAFRLNVVHLTSSFITSSIVQASGSNIFGDEAGTDVQTLIGTTKMTGSAEVTGSLKIMTQQGNSAGFIADHLGSSDMNFGIGTNSPSTNHTLTIGGAVALQSYLSASSYISASAFSGDGSGLTNLPASDPFPFTGDAQITGSLIVSGAAEFRGVEDFDTNVVIGKDATSTGQYSVVIGKDAGISSGGSENVVIGHSANLANNTLYNVVIGEGAYGSGAGSIAIGEGATAAGEGVAIGRGANVSDYRGIAIGRGATAGLNQLQIGNSTYEPIISGSLETGHIILSQTSSDGYSQGGLEVHGSGSNVFEVIGSEGTLFTIDDDLDGVIFTANNRTGNPVLQASASGEVYIGSTPQSLYTTAVISSTTANISQSIFGLSTSSYGGVFVDYTAHSGSNARAGSIMSVWNPNDEIASGADISFAETTTLDIGDTSNLLMQVVISQSQAQVQSYATTAGYNIKTIIRSI